MMRDTLPDYRSKSANRVERLFLTLICASMALAPPSLQAQDIPAASSGRTEAEISLSLEVGVIKYQREGTVAVRYRIANGQKREIYLVTAGKVSPAYDLGRKALVIGLHKEILNYHYLDYPRLEKIKPGKSYQGEASISLSFLRQHFIEGRWLLYLSIGYLDANGMAEIRGLLKTHHPEELGQQFDQRQQVLLVGPIEIELSER